MVLEPLSQRLILNEGRESVGERKVFEPDGALLCFEGVEGGDEDRRDVLSCSSERRLRVDLSRCEASGGRARVISTGLASQGGNC